MTGKEADALSALADRLEKDGRLSGPVEIRKLLREHTAPPETHAEAGEMRDKVTAILKEVTTLGALPLMIARDRICWLFECSSPAPAEGLLWAWLDKWGKEFPGFTRDRTQTGFFAQAMWDMYNEILALTTPTAQGSPRVCVWAQGDDGGSWDTSCKESFGFNDGGPAENDAKFCIYCGKPIEAMPYSDKDYDDEDTPEPPQGKAGK